MPERVSLTEINSPTFSVSYRSLSPIVLVFLIAILVGFIVLRLTEPTQFVGVLTVGVTIASIAALLFARRYVNDAREREISAMFRDLFANSGDPAIVEDQFGVIVEKNAAVNLDMDQTIDNYLGDIFDDASELEHKLRKAVKLERAAIEVVVDRDGDLKEIELRRFGSKCLIWTVRAAQNAKLDSSTLAIGGRVAIFSLDEHGIISDANERALSLGLVAGQKLQTLLDGEVRQGGLCSFKGKENRFRSYIFGTEDDLSQAFLVPVDGEDLSGASSDQFLGSLPVAIARVSPKSELLYLNSAAKNLLGDGAEPGTNLNQLLEGLGRSMDERIKDMMQGRAHMRTEVARGKVNGHEIFLQVTLDRIVLEGETSVLAVLNDATELKTLEAQFVQSQKMQAVGQLAGGVAHDFNNLLTAINGHCDLILMRHETTDTDYGDLIQIRHNANRAASLVGQLLAFSRKQTLLPKVIDLYDTLSDLNHLLNRLLGEKVTLRIEHAENLPCVRVDERQLEQVIMNLVVNARDAMPNGGEVVIQTNSVEFETDKKMDRVVIPFGTYVKIDVTDTGVGIPEDKISKIFEPFFTTKGVGEGTGLGLSTAYGIIKQTGGFIFAESEVGSGTTFTLYLPTHADHHQIAVSDDRQKPEPTDLTGRGVVLLVEDEVPVRSFAARALNIRGYSVIEAGSAEEALDILEDATLHVDIFVSDVIMPGMDGPTWVRMAQKTRPNTRVVFVSGYAEDVFEGGQISVPNATFLPKPFSLNELTHTVKEQMEMEIA